MKKMLYGILIWMTIIGLVGCKGNQTAQGDVTTDMTVEEMAEVIAASQQELPVMSETVWPEDECLLWITDYYLIDEGQVEDGAVFYGDGVEASEIAVVRLSDRKNGETVQTALTGYVENRARVFEGYAPLQAALAENGMVVINGDYVALMICQDTSAAKEAFLECFEKAKTGSGSGRQASLTDIPGTKAAAAEITEAETVKAAGKETESMETEKAGYDSRSVLEAWRTGDGAGLSDQDRRILEAAQVVIGQEIKDGMSDYEKELAIHDWITGWCRFDYSVFGRSSADGFEDGSNTPYGVLINRSAMCHGYSSTFQLFMDMLDIPCITVFGTPGGNGVEHSWNMVRLDGEWYCVDTAWDDPIGGSPGHTYFNVTSDYLRGGSIHRWDDSSVPEADGAKYGYGNQRADAE